MEDGLWLNLCKCPVETAVPLHPKELADLHEDLQGQIPNRSNPELIQRAGCPLRKFLTLVVTITTMLHRNTLAIEFLSTFLSGKKRGTDHDFRRSTLRFCPLSP